MARSKNKSAKPAETTQTTTQTKSETSPGFFATFCNRKADFISAAVTTAIVLALPLSIGANLNKFYTGIITNAIAIPVVNSLKPQENGKPKEKKNYTREDTIKDLAIGAIEAVASSYLFAASFDKDILTGVKGALKHHNLAPDAYSENIAIGVGIGYSIATLLMTAQIAQLFKKDAKPFNIKENIGTYAILSTLFGAKMALYQITDAGKGWTMYAGRVGFGALLNMVCDFFMNPTNKKTSIEEHGYKYATSALRGALNGVLYSAVYNTISEPVKQYITNLGSTLQNQAEVVAAAVSMSIIEGIDNVLKAYSEIRIGQQFDKEASASVGI